MKFVATYIKWFKKAYNTELNYLRPIILFFGFSLIFLFKGNAQTFLCEGFIYDSGGNTSNYANNEATIATYCSDNNFEIHVNFSAFQLENNFDFLHIYDGDSVNSALIGSFTGSNSPGQIQSTQSCITLEFTSDAQNTDIGYSASISCFEACDVEITDVVYTPTECGEQNGSIEIFASGGVPNTTFEYSIDGGVTFYSNPYFEQLPHANYNVVVKSNGVCLVYEPQHYLPQACTEICGNNIDDDLDGLVDESGCHQVIYTCNSMFYDDGGPTESYNFNTDYLTTYCSPGTEQIQAIFKEFELDLGILADTLLVYDGIDSQGELLGKYYGRPIVTGEEFRIKSFFQSTTGCLTFHMKSGEFGTRLGWEAEILCTKEIINAVEICGNGIDDDLDGFIDEQDVNCAEANNELTCQDSFVYYLPPVWQMDGNPIVYSLPTFLSLSTVSPSANVHIATADNSYQNDISITNVSGETINLENDLLKTNQRNTVEANKGLIFTSDSPLRINFSLNGYLNRNFVSVKGNEALGKSFIVGSQTNTLVKNFESVQREERHFISVMAVEDATTVTFLSDRPMQGISSEHTVVLNYGESYIITDEDNNVTVSGLKIRSDKDIVVNSGSQHTNAYQVLDDDGGVDMLVPIKHLGQDYIVTRGSVHNEQDYVVVVAAENDTKVFIGNDANPVAQLNSGGFKEIKTRGSSGEAMYIHGSKPIAVFHVTGQTDGEVGMAMVPTFGQCIGDKKIQFDRFSLTDDMTLQAILPGTGLPSLFFNGVHYTQLAGTTVHVVEGKEDYVSVVITDSHIENQNTIESTESLQVALLIGDATNTGSIAWISSYSKKIEIIDDQTGYATDKLSLPLQCANSTSEEYILQIESCGSDNRIVSIEQGDLGVVSLTGDLSFTYSAGEDVGQDQFMLNVANDQGIRSAVCFSVVIDSVFVDFNLDDQLVCSNDETLLQLDSIGGQGPYEFYWSTGETTPSILVSPDFDQQFEVTISDSRGCEGSAAIHFEVLPTVVSEAGADLSVCFDEVAHLDANQPTGTMGIWTGGSGTFDDVLDPKAIYSPSAAESGTSFYLYWTLDGQSDDMCFEGTDSLKITLTDFLEVFAGDDQNVCSGSAFNLSQLGAQLNSNSINDAVWMTNGDGYFIPQNSSEGSFLTSTHYQPGQSDLASGEVQLALSALDPNGAPPCNEDQDEVSLFLTNVPIFACNDHLNISLGANCTVVVEPNMLLESVIEPLEFYTIILEDQYGNLIPNNILNSSHIGQIIDYTISYYCGGNSCSGTIMVEDKQIPELDCQDITVDCTEDITPEALGFPVPTNTTIYTLEDHYVVEGFDGCGQSFLTFEDDVSTEECVTGFQSIITRTWEIADLAGNETSCVQTIFIEYIGLDEVMLPPNYDDIDLESFSCTDDFPMTTEGYPAPSFTGAPTAGYCTKIEATYTDIYFPLCGGGYKILRDWLVFDWCNNTSIQHYQVIMVIDKTPPVAYCQSDVTISTDEYSCNSGLYLLANPTIIDDCSEWTIQAEVIDSSGNEANITNQSGNLLVGDLAIGTHEVLFEVSDECGNTTNCSYHVTVMDQVVPTVVCESHTKISLTNAGIARLYATSINDESHDNCGIASMEIRKLTDECGFGFEFGPYVDLCCAEIGEIVEVVLQITDIYGNTNHCVAEVEVEDKLAPYISAPDDLTISCTTDYDVSNLLPFGKIASSQIEQGDIIIYDELNDGVVGKDGIAIDNCDFTLKDSFDLDIHCGEGTITRIFTATDSYNQISTATQTITIVNADVFTYDRIIWPANISVDGCKDIVTHPDSTGKPTFVDPGCSSLKTSYEDKLFSSVDSACVLILRTWAVLDECQFDPNTGAGLWEKIQTIKLNNTIAPIFTSDLQDTVVCTYGDCSGDIHLEIHAEDDCTQEENLVYTYDVDEDNDGDMDYWGVGNEFNQFMQNGLHRIYWKVEDGCGNVQTATYLFEVKDCKNPTPYCQSDIVTVIMGNTGQIDIWASDFDLGSYDNCTATEDLHISFSSDTTDTQAVFSCDQILNGVSQVFDLEMWVTDQAGNQDYCSVQVEIQDNGNHCDDGLGLTISGQNLTSSLKPINNVQMILTEVVENQETNITTGLDGTYAFNDLPSQVQYKVKPNKDDLFLNGVTTLDIILIQKHILSLQPFQDLYQFVAADVNNSGSVTGTDIIQIRKGILAYYEGFPNNASWRFVDESIGLNPNDVYNFPEEVYFNPLETNAPQTDFTGIKIGDVNNTVKPQNNVSKDIIVRSDEVQIVTYIVDDQLVFSLVNDENLYGFQFEIQWDAILGRIYGINSNKLSIDRSNINIDSDGMMRISYNSNEPIQLVAGTELFSIELDMKENLVDFARDLNIIDLDFQAEWIEGDLSLRNLQLNYEDQALDIMEHDIIVMQNRPNPFRSEALIDITIPETMSIDFEITDVTGNRVYIEKMVLPSGKQEILITPQMVTHPGIYFYHIHHNGNTMSNKMIKMN